MKSLHQTTSLNPQFTGKLQMATLFIKLSIMRVDNNKLYLETAMGCINNMYLVHILKFHSVKFEK